MVLATDPSTVARPIAAVSDSRVNQETLIPASMTLWASASTKWVLPVPDGDGEVLRTADPFQGGQPGLGARRDGGVFLAPGIEGLPGREPGGLAAHPSGGLVAALDLLGDQHPQHFGGVPALGPGGGQDVRCRRTQVGQPHPLEHCEQFLGQLRSPPGPCLGGGHGATSGCGRRRPRPTSRAGRSGPRLRPPAQRPVPHRHGARRWRAGRLRRTDRTRWAPAEAASTSQECAPGPSPRKTCSAWLLTRGFGGRGPPSGVCGWSG